MQFFALFAAAALLTPTLAGCSGGSRESEPVAARSARLVGGTPDTGDPAVVLFQTTGPQGGECTADFVSTTVLLTAAHCVLTDSGKPLTGAGFRIYLGNDIADATEADWIPIDPSNVHAHPSFQGDDHDIAVLVLSEPVAVTPLPFNAEALSREHVGKSVRLVGYGANVAPSEGGDDGFGLKRELTTTIAGVDPSFVEVGSPGKTACGGDSGGPALLEIDGVETIIGLDSYSDAYVDCTESEFYQRVDVEADFIAEFLTPPSSGSGGDGGSGDDGGDDDDDDDGGATTGAGASSASADGAAPDTSGTCTLGRTPRGSRPPAWALAVAFGLALSRAARRERRGSLRDEQARVRP